MLVRLREHHRRQAHALKRVVDLPGGAEDHPMDADGFQPRRQKADHLPRVTRMVRSESAHLQQIDTRHAERGLAGDKVFGGRREILLDEQSLFRRKANAETRAQMIVAIEKTQDRWHERTQTRIELALIDVRHEGLGVSAHRIIALDRTNVAQRGTFVAAGNIAGRKAHNCSIPPHA